MAPTRRDEGTFPRTLHGTRRECTTRARVSPRLHLPARVYLPSGTAKGTEFQLPFITCDLTRLRVLVPNQVIRADDLGGAMVDVAISETRESRNVVLENHDIRAMVESLRRAAV